MKYNLSEVNELIKDRRTIYPEFYSERKVHKEQIELLLNNAIWAPSHGLTQPWRFKVFMGEGKTRLGEFMRDLYIKKTPSDEVNAIKLGRNTNRPAKASRSEERRVGKERRSRMWRGDEIIKEST